MGNALTPLATAQEPSDAQLSVYPAGEGPFFVHTFDAEGKIRYAPSGPASEKETPAMTIPALMRAAVKSHPNEPALYQEPLDKIGLVGGKAPPALRLEEWASWTWKQYYDDVELAARAMMSLGLVQHDSCTIYGYNSPQWMISALAAMFAGAKASGVYPSDTAEQLKYKALHSRSSIVLVESNTHLDTLRKVISELPYVKAVVVWSEAPSETKLEHAQVLGWKEFLSKSAATSAEVLQQRISSLKPGNPCSLIYTSGTTGQPKAVMVSHDNLVFEAKMCLCIGIGNDVASTPHMQERVLSYLPLSHVAGQMVDVIAPIALTALRPGYCSTFYARPYDLKVGSLVERLRVVRPTLFLGVPRVWEKVAEKMKQIGAKTVGTKKKIATWAKAKGLAYQENMQLGGSGKKPFNYGLANKIVLSKVKAGLGLGEMKFAFSGAAPMTVDTLQYFGQLGMNINEVYGMSESTGATTWSTDQAHVWGTVGYALPGMEVRILRPGGKECPRAKTLVNIPDECQGEICFRGRHVMLGYLANAEFGQAHVDEIVKKNSEAIDADGWLRSGDMGVKTDKGMVKITGRYKELIIGAGGENVAPVPIEDEIKRLGAGVVSNVQMIGDKRKYNVVFITLACKGSSGEKPGSTELEDTVTSRFPGLVTIADATKSAELVAFLDSIITQTNKNGAVCPSNAATVAKYTILPLDFSVETDELTATLKLKRSVVEQKNVATLNAMYEDGGKAMFFNHVG